MTAINTVLSTAQSQVEVSYNFDVNPVRFIPSVLNVRLLPRVGQAQVVEIIIRIAHSGAGGFIDTTMLVSFYDQAFEEFNLFGQRRAAETSNAKARQEEF